MHFDVEFESTFLSGCVKLIAFVGRAEASPPLSVEFAEFSLYLLIYL